MNKAKVFIAYILILVFISAFAVGIHSFTTAIFPGLEIALSFSIDGIASVAVVVFIYFLFLKPLLSEHNDKIRRNTLDEVLHGARNGGYVIEENTRTTCTHVTELRIFKEEDIY
ncbi:MAG: hypothetical protein VB081_09975 [Christensenella sp.]|uniref:hypothetical protein n=1 Tax=Christensenella sp. TaxID=1935934 RepID=UPI002B21B8F5|nr:hypothetical protein [Christensenella sp.]MEA5003813.1 hypothetical protein [Christensenella sp.]